VMGMLAPAGIAPKIVARLQAEIAKVMREPAMAARMEQLGMVMEENGTANYIEFRRRDAERYAAIVRKLNLQVAK
jgi:tripartite-type tricarboxylate transporter receptor subunit TctC